MKVSAEGSRRIFMSPLRQILTGPPVSRSAQRKLGIARFIPGLGFAVRRCHQCQEKTWLGPNQLAQPEAMPWTEILCRSCSDPMLAAGLKDGSIIYDNLGGRGPGYFMSDGRYFGPPEEFRN